MGAEYAASRVQRQQSRPRHSRKAAVPAPSCVPLPNIPGLSLVPRFASSAPHRERAAGRNECLPLTPAPAPASFTYSPPSKPELNPGSRSKLIEPRVPHRVIDHHVHGAPLVGGLFEHALNVLQLRAGRRPGKGVVVVVVVVMVVLVGRLCWQRREGLRCRGSP